MIGLMVNPPKEGDDSYNNYIKEKNNILNSLRNRAELVSNKLNNIENMSSQFVQGALYAFPTIKLPEKAIFEAQNKGMDPDSFYCYELLKDTGICTVPGSGFMQRKHTYHLRTTLLPPEDVLDRVLNDMETFHKKFWEKYS